jgi:hypothetical protein
MSGLFRKAFVTMALVALLAASARASVIGKWLLNEHQPTEQATGATGEIIDSSGNGHHGTVAGTSMPYYIPGVGSPPSAIEFASIDAQNRITAPTSTGFDMMFSTGNSYTIEAVIKADAAVWTAQGDTFYSPTIFSHDDASTNNGYAFRVENTNKGGGLHKLGFYYENYDGSHTCSANPDAMSTSALPLDNQWHHVAVVLQYNADPTLTAAKFYIDGVLDGSPTLASVAGSTPGESPWVNNNLVSTQDAWIGNFILNRTQDRFLGGIDGVAFSNAALGPGSFVLSVPEPATLSVLCTGLMGLLAYAWRKRK